MTHLTLVHSPLLGPLSWTGVAEQLNNAGYAVTVPDLRPALGRRSGYQSEIAAIVAAGSPHEPTVLVGHSGAGPVLPTIASAITAEVSALIYVDAMLPYPGDCWFDHAPKNLTDTITGLAHDGLLPPWNEWFPPDALDSMIIDPDLRAAFLAELPSCPLAFFEEPCGTARWTGPQGYLLLSEGYRTQATGLVTRDLPIHHLAMLTNPGDIATALIELSQAVLEE